MTALFNLLLDDPALFFRYSLFRLPTLLIALSFHEWGHAFVANRCGDPTARLLGRMTFNPLKHLDPIGTLLMFTVGFGWARPVPVNPNNFRNRRWDDLKVSLAGVTINFILFLLLTTIATAINRWVWAPDAFLYSLHGGVMEVILSSAQLQDTLRINPVLYIFNSDTFREVTKSPVLGEVQFFLLMGAQINLMLGIFNLFPIPPLDGYHVFNDILLGGRLHLPPQVMRFGMMAILALSFLTNILSDVMSFLYNNIQGAVLAVLALITGG